MTILVLVKQVPDTLNVSFDPEDHFLVRHADHSMLSPFDQCALEAAARLKDQDGSIQIIALSMGEPSAASVLRDALAICADEAYLVSDPLLKGADTGLTARVLAAVVRKIEVDRQIKIDLICCGTRLWTVHRQPSGLCWGDFWTCHLSAIS